MSSCAWVLPITPFARGKCGSTVPPQVAVEVISASDERDRDWGAKLDRYRRLGVEELVRFDPESSEAIRVWDAVEGNLVERSSEAATRCNVLSAFWVIVSNPDLGSTLRLSHDPEGHDLYFTPAERAERRVEELEAELRRRGGES
jgi:Putative restriction endonuclease